MRSFFFIVVPWTPEEYFMNDLNSTKHWTKYWSKNIGHYLLNVFNVLCICHTWFSPSENFSVVKSWVITGKCSFAQGTFPTVSETLNGNIFKAMQVCALLHCCNCSQIYQLWGWRKKWTNTRKYCKSRLWKRLILNHLICITHIESGVCFYKKSHLHYRLGQLDLVYTYKLFIHKFNS